MVNDRRRILLSQSANRFRIADNLPGAGQKLAGPFAPADVHRSPYCPIRGLRNLAERSADDQFRPTYPFPPVTKNRTLVIKAFLG